MSLIETDLLNKKIEIVMRQTNYTEDETKQLLNENNYDELLVIRNYLGVKTEVREKEKVNSVNQEIYKQLRYRLNDVMRGYNERVSKGEAKKIL